MSIRTIWKPRALGLVADRGACASRHLPVAALCLLAGALVALTLCFALPGPALAQDAATPHVRIFDHTTYYEVHLDVAGAESPWKLGYEYGQAVLEADVYFPAIAKLYLKAADWFFMDQKISMPRALELKKNLPLDVQQQIEGMAAAIKDAGQGWILSENDCYLMSLFPDAARDTQCSALGAWGARTPDGKPVVGRILDWTTLILPAINSVTVYHDGDQSFCSIGFLGLWQVISGFNENGLFGGILDAKTGKPYPSDLTGYRSYPMDLRLALETCSTKEEAAKVLQPPHKYTFCHQIIFADKRGAAVLENDLNSTGPYARQLRTDTTPLNSGITWGFKNAVCAVNSFLSQGNDSTAFSEDWNKLRWNEYTTMMKTLGKQVSWDHLKQMLSDGSPTQHTMPYNDLSLQLMVYKPSTGSLEVGFIPRNMIAPAKPNWQSVDVDFSGKVFDSTESTPAGTPWRNAWKAAGWQQDEAVTGAARNGDRCVAVQLRKGSAEAPTDLAIGVARYRANGSPRWIRVLDLPAAFATLNDASVSQNGAITIAGRRELSGSAEWMVARYGQKGTRMWTRMSSGAAAGDEALAIEDSGDGRVVVAGTVSRGPAGDGAAQQDWCVQAYAPNGRLLWTRFVGSPGASDRLAFMRKGPDGSIIVSGTWNALAAGGGESCGIAAARYTLSGRRLWLTRWSHAGISAPVVTQTFRLGRETAVTAQCAGAAGAAEISSRAGAAESSSTAGANQTAAGATQSSNTASLTESSSAAAQVEIALRLNTANGRVIWSLVTEP